MNLNSLLRSGRKQEITCLSLIHVIRKSVSNPEEIMEGLVNYLHPDS